MFISSSRTWECIAPTYPATTLIKSWSISQPCTRCKSSCLKLPSRTARKRVELLFFVLCTTTCSLFRVYVLEIKYRFNPLRRDVLARTPGGSWKVAEHAVLQAACTHKQANGTGSQRAASRRPCHTHSVCRRVGDATTRVQEPGAIHHLIRQRSQHKIAEQKRQGGGPQMAV